MQDYNHNIAHCCLVDIVSAVIESGVFGKDPAPVCIESTVNNIHRKLRRYCKNVSIEAS